MLAPVSDDDPTIEEMSIQPYWEWPDKKLKGSDDISAIYHAVGIALTYWELVEEMYARLFAHLVESPSDAAKRAYGSIISASGRHDALEAASVIFFGDRRSDVGFSVCRKYLKARRLASARRNEIAHGMATHYSTPAEPQHGAFLVPPFYNTGKTEAYVDPDDDDPLAVFKGKYRVDADDISTFSVKIQRLYRVAESYVYELGVRFPRRPSV